MNVTDYTCLINKPNSITENQSDALAKVLDEFPYFQSARAMRLKGLYNQNSFKYNFALKVTAAHTTDRSVLFDFITSESFIAIQKDLYEKKSLELLDINVIDSEIVISKNDLKVEISPSEKPISHSIIENKPSDSSKLIEEKLDIGQPLDFSINEIQNFSGLLSVVYGVFGIILIIDTIKQQEEQNIQAQNKKEEEGKNELKYKLELLKVDLKNIMEDMTQKSVYISDYVQELKTSSNNASILRQTSSRNFTRAIEMDRLAIFKSFKLYWPDQVNWIKDFSQLYNILDYLPQFYESVYEKYDYHSKDIYKKKMDVRTDLILLMQRCDETILQLQNNSSGFNFQFVIDVITKLKTDYETNIVSESQVDGSELKETNFQDLKTLVIDVFIDKATNVAEGCPLPTGLFPLIAFSNNINIKIDHIKSENINFGMMLENQNNKIYLNDDSTLKKVTEIYNKIPN